MKKSLLLIFIFSCLLGYAQNIAFPYSTTVRDANGLAITSTAITATATISLQGFNQEQLRSGSATSYTETHNVSTDANGLLSLIVGEGTPSSSTSLSDLDWGAGSYQINITTNPGSTNVTFPIYSAPIALFSIESQTVSGGSDPSNTNELIQTVQLANNNETLQITEPNNAKSLDISALATDSEVSTAVGSVSSSLSSLSTSVNQAQTKSIRYITQLSPTGDYTLTATDYTVLVQAGSFRTINLPTGTQGRILRIIFTLTGDSNEDTNQLTLQNAQGQLANIYTPFTRPVNFSQIKRGESITIQFDGNGWTLIDASFL